MIRIKLYVLSLSMAGFFCAKGQTKEIYMGLGIGPETVISVMLPKVSYYNFRDSSQLPVFYGAEATISGIAALWFAGDLTLGIRKDFFTYENSLGYWLLPRQQPNAPGKIGPYSHFTFNPKLGVKFSKIWFKTGPSFILARSYSDSLGNNLADLTKLGNIRLNVELLINIPISTISFAKP